ncbi:MAG: ComEC/Rec2 family competence protein [Bacteroidales bacterium]
MNPWHKLPFLRLILPFLIGILLGNSGLIINPEIKIMLLVLVACQWLTLHFHHKLFPYHLRWIAGMIINLFLLFAGVQLGFQNYIPYHSGYYGNFFSDSDEQTWLVEIEGPLHEREKTIKTSGQVQYLIDNERNTPVKGKIHLSFKKDSSVNELKRGDQILIKTRLRKIQGPQIPYSFDYAAFSARKGIFYQAYLLENDWRVVRKNQGFSLRQHAWEWQQILVKIIRDQSIGKEEQAVGCAMLLGYTDGFGQDLQGAYSRAGVTHILSVSGLHVGLIFFIFNRLLFFLNKTQKQRSVKTALLVVLTWLYAMLTGLAPCVQRAAFMFSLLIVGQSMKRKNNIVNTLFASAFILLWINPLNIYDYGFQLSYLAVLGIIWIEPIISSALYINNKLIEKVWKLTAVTLAAQIATAPLASFHFHQFPTWFIPANLVVIPLSTLVMYLGICLLLTSPLPWISIIIKYLFVYSIQLMNTLILLTDELPLPVIEGLYPSVTSVIFCFLMIISLSGWLITAKKNWAFMALIHLCLYSISLSFCNIQKKNTTQFAFFNTNKNDWMAVTHLKTMVLFSDENALADSNNLKIRLKNWIARNEIRSLHWYSTSRLKFKDTSCTNSSFHLLWIRKNASTTRFSEGRIEFMKVILAGNLTFKERQKWIGRFRDSDIPVHDIRSEGCILMN